MDLEKHCQRVAVGKRQSKSQPAIWLQPEVTTCLSTNRAMPTRNSKEIVDHLYGDFLIRSQKQLIPEVINTNLTSSRAHIPKRNAQEVVDHLYKDFIKRSNKTNVADHR